MADENNKKGKTITDDEGHEFTFDDTAEARENDIQVIDVTEKDDKRKPKGETVTDEERQANFELD